MQNLDGGNIATVVRRRALLVLLGVGLAVSSLSGSAWAHGWLPLFDESPAATQTELQSARHLERESPSQASANGQVTPHHPAAPAIVLMAGALVLLAGITRRRRTLALTLALLLGLVAFEGVFHAALHLRQIPHPDSLAIGAGATPQALADLDVEGAAAPPLTLLGKTRERYDPPVSDVGAASNQGRAPPVGPA